MANQYVNKVELADGTTLIDISSDTVTAGSMVSGTTAHDASGAAITGTITTQPGYALTLTEKTTYASVDAPAGYYPSGGSYTLNYSTSAGTSAGITPNTGVVDYGVTVAKGYLASNKSFSGTLQLSTVAGTTITPTRSEQTAAAKWKWTTGDIKVAAIPSAYKTLEEIYPVDSLWATYDDTANPATELGFGTWTQVSPIQPTWNRLKQTTTWAAMQVDAPTVFVWQRTS